MSFIEMWFKLITFAAIVLVAYRIKGVGELLEKFLKDKEKKSE